MYIYCVRGKENLRFDFLILSTSFPSYPIDLEGDAPYGLVTSTQKALRLTVIMSSFVNYFAPLAQDGRMPIAREPVKNAVRNRRSIARVARRRAIERQRTDDAQVEHYESLTRNIDPHNLREVDGVWWKEGRRVVTGDLAYIGGR
jgi:hypothetical protein